MKNFSRSPNSILIFILLCLLGVSQANSQTKISKEVGILWEISKPDIAPSYVFGTIHSEDKRVNNFPDPVVSSFNGAKTFILEILFDKANNSDVLKKMYFATDEDFRSVVGATLFQLSVDAMQKKGFTSDVITKMKPWAVFAILNLPEQKTGLFMDVLLYQKAKQQQKIIRALETEQEQTAIFDEMPMASQVALLKSTLENLLEFDKILEEMIGLYLQRDINKLMEYSRQFEKSMDKEVAADFNQRLIINRNHRMVKRMMPMLEEGYCFVAVGALHLPGQEGILQLLKARGFKVKAIY